MGNSAVISSINPGVAQHTGRTKRDPANCKAVVAGGARRAMGQKEQRTVEAQLFNYNFPCRYIFIFSGDMQEIYSFGIVLHFNS